MQPESRHNLTLSNVSKQYGRGVPVIDSFSHDFEAGTATALTGPNGSGKTTLLRLLAVTSFPSSGVISFAGKSIHEAPYTYLQHVGIVHDESALPEYMSAVELLEYALRSRNKWTSNSPAEIDQLLDSLLLDERRQNLIGTYSSGMLKKTQIGMALVAAPAVLLMDEPFRGLDSESLEAATTRFEALKKKGSLMVIASHRKDMLSLLCDSYIDLASHQTQQPSNTTA